MLNVESSQAASSEINQILQNWTSGHPKAGERMVSLVYCDLHRIAEGFARERQEVVPKADVLVQNAYQQLFGTESVTWEGRTHFLSVAARVMRLVLVNYCQQLPAVDRVADWSQISFAEEELALANSRFGLKIAPIRPSQILALNEAIAYLESINPNLARVVELRFFAGLCLDGTAECMERPREEVDRLWLQAWTWLRAEWKDLNARPGASQIH